MMDSLAGAGKATLRPLFEPLANPWTASRLVRTIPSFTVVFSESRRSLQHVQCWLSGAHLSVPLSSMSCKGPSLETWIWRSGHPWPGETG